MQIPVVEWTFNIVKTLQIQKCFFPKQALSNLPQNVFIRWSDLRKWVKVKRPKLPPKTYIKDLICYKDV